ncbi:uncharacterized protein N7500_003796 [Penicillium coprophilum]|uniref:uncharacterized protein n=1 Tax=Penicillium coprophilum TaxID=36646 RepID=UPI00238CAED8|nr:uncharacterized protein N7500_003796 [Penicillium coprophilum]KAJ5171013.1 hypothetical protein N7500_003796 [Penicillium coprophilum]
MSILTGDFEVYLEGRANIYLVVRTLAYGGKKGKGNQAPIEASTPPKPRRESSARRQDAKDPRASPTRDSPQPAVPCEPRQPQNLHDLLDYRLEMGCKPKNNAPGASPSPPGKSHLRPKDIKAMLSGAPHFLLEKGRHGRWFPQVIFPWDEQNPIIQHMWDRKPLPHASFTLSTLHAHLPVPDDWVAKGGFRSNFLTGAAEQALQAEQHLMSGFSKYPTCYPITAKNLAPLVSGTFLNYQ